MHPSLKSSDLRLSSRNEDQRSKFLRLLDEINHNRSQGHSALFYFETARAAGEVAEDLIKDWLRLHKPKVDHSCFIFLTVPFITFRLLNTPGKKPVRLDKHTPTQIKNFLDAMYEELHEIQGEREVFDAITKVQLNVITEFLGFLVTRQIQ